MKEEAKAVKKAVTKPMSLRAHRLNRAKKIMEYATECINSGEKIDKAFLKELGDIA